MTIVNRVIYPTALFSALGLLSACTATLPVAPSPTQNLSNPETGVYLTLDLREGSGVPVIVNGQELNLLVLARPSALLAINRDIADTLDLRPVLFGLGSATVVDGDHRVTGEVVRARYEIGGAQAEAAWALVMEEDIHPDYDGAISFGAIPADVFRITLADNDPADPGAWQEARFTGRSEALEQSRDYEALEFSHRLALYQDETTLNRKASFYLHQAGRLANPGEVNSFRRLFGNARAHRPAEITPSLPHSLGEARNVWIEVNEDGGLPGARPAGTDPDTIIVHYDPRSTRHAPTLYLGRDAYSHCYEIEVAKDQLSQTEQTLRMRCGQVGTATAHGAD